MNLDRFMRSLSQIRGLMATTESGTPYPVAQGVLGRPLLERGGLLTGSRARREANGDGSMGAVGGAAGLSVSVK